MTTLTIPATRAEARTERAPTTPGDPPCRVAADGPWPGCPAWLRSYLATSIETEYADWAPSWTQRRQLAERGLPVPATWVEAKAMLGRKRKRTAA